MGHEIESAALGHGHTVVATFDIDHPASVDNLRSCGAEVVIDFSQPNAVIDNIALVASAQLPVVIGTTGWDSSLPIILAQVAQAKIGCVVGSNFSVGVNLFLEIVRTASRLLGTAGYDAYISEAHHRTKKDFPSGTALRIGDAVLSEMKSKVRISTELPAGAASPPDALLITSIRAGGITGTHTVGFESEEDSIELVHRAKNRRGFAYGAVVAAEWIVNRTGFYRFEEHITEILNDR